MIGRIALLLGLLVIPLLILAGGHRFRDQTTTRRRLFWGAVLGHAAGMIVCVAFAMFPPIWWNDGPAWRDFVVHWSMVIGAVAGGVIAVATATKN